MTLVTLERWTALCARLGAQRDVGEAFSDIIGMYGQSHRRYHTLTHLDHCLRELDAVRDYIPHPAEVEYALWYHDFFYNPRSDANEVRSAAAASYQLMLMLVPTYQPLADRVKMHINATAKHAKADDVDTRFVLDIDLAILGQPADVFDQYEAHIRDEYDFYSNREFSEGRARILDGLCNREPIYQTSVLRGKYERRARGNLMRSISQLREAA